MSHDATNWAIKQRGIKPALKVVLWNLCDRYHPDNGCFPSQDTLAADCEVPRSTLNVYLDTLESMGLIAREQRRERGSNRQERTRYRFPFEPDFPEKTSKNPSPETGHGAESRNGPEPSPENGESRVQNLDSNPVREPVRETRKGREGACAGNEGSGEDLKELRQRFRVLEIGTRGNPWPLVASTNADWAFRQFVKLTPEERALAEKHRDAFLAACPKIKSGDRKGEANAPMLGAYLSSKRWELLPAIAPGRPARGGNPQERRDAVAGDTEHWATAYGPLHAAVLFRILLDGPERPDLVPTNGLWLSSHFRSAWPKLAAFWQQTDLKGGIVASPADEQLVGSMEFIPADTETMTAWREEMKRRSLPEVRLRDGMRGLYFPCGGPDRLIDFELTLREAWSDEHAA